MATRRKGKNESKRWVLLGLLGKSPAVLTETVWALAHGEPAVVPDEVVVLTTRPGAELVRRVLVESEEWEGLRNCLARRGVPVQGKLRFGSDESVRVFPRPDGSGDMEDLLTAADSLAAADQMMRVLRSFTEDPEVRLVVSIAGGRKTMSALMTACMCLLGRPEDRVCHVLVNPPYDRPDLQPLFLYPQPGLTHRLPDDPVEYSAEAARIELAEVPFVRVRPWYEHRFKTPPPSYTSLVRRVQENLEASEYWPRLTVNLKDRRCEVDGRPVQLSYSEFAFLVAVLLRLRAGRRIEKWSQVVADMARWQERVRKGEFRDSWWLLELADVPLDALEGGRKLAYRVRKKLAEVLGEETSWIDDLLTLPQRKLERMQKWAQKRLTLQGEAPDTEGRPRDVPKDRWKDGDERR
ncbi:MAG: hypothetical protein Kow00109_22560 [Acidobacteriota bacterium]